MTNEPAEIIESNGHYYRLSPDYQPPVQRWVLNPETLVVDWTYDKTIKTGWLEVTAEYAAYLQAKPEGEWELRKPDVGEVYLAYHGVAEVCRRILVDGGKPDRGYRWCKPRKVAGWVEYPVVLVDDYYAVQYPTGTTLSLSLAANRVGFGGVRFDRGMTDDRWFMVTTKLAQNDGLYESGMDYETGLKPAVPVRCRFWEVAK